MNDKEALALSKTKEMQEQIKKELLALDSMAKWKEMWKSMGTIGKIELVNSIVRKNKLAEEELNKKNSSINDSLDKEKAQYPKVLYSILEDPERMEELENKLGITKEALQEVHQKLQEDMIKNPGFVKSKKKKDDRN